MAESEAASKLNIFADEQRSIWQGHNNHTQAVIGIIIAYNKEFGVEKDLELIKDRLAILAPPDADLDLHPGLRDLYDQYKMLEAFILGHKNE